jgi:hypothetical protein
MKKHFYLSIQALKVLIFVGFGLYFILWMPEGDLPREAYLVFAGFLFIYSVILIIRIIQRLRED